MSFLQNDFYNSPSEPFELVPHASYSHGLEKIYGKLETIDIRSVRKISSISASSVEPQSKKQLKVEPANSSDQLEFNLEPYFRKTLEPFVLRERIGNSMDVGVLPEGKAPTSIALNHFINV